MFSLLAQILMLDIKNYWVQSFEPTFSGYSYIIAFGCPMIVMILLASDMMYEKYLAKLQNSHVAIYQKFIGILVLLTLSAMTFVMMLGIYVSKPESTEWLGLASLIPYYICWAIISGMYIYISPGLLDPHNKIPF